MFPSYPTVTSNMLEPTEEETAMSPKPFLATMTLVIRSGIDVPAARKVRPITCKQKCILSNDGGQTKWLLSNSCHRCKILWSERLLRNVWRGRTELGGPIHIRLL